LDVLICFLTFGSTLPFRYCLCTSISYISIDPYCSPPSCPASFTQESSPHVQNSHPSPSTPGFSPTKLTTLTASESLSRQTYRALLKLGIINPAHPNGIDTTKIDSKFANKLSFISIYAQRKVVGLLFFWEQEVVRWRLLDEEEAEIKEVIGEGKDVPADLKVALERVKMRRGMRPSEREESGDGTTAGEAGALPEYNAQS
jgi:hypothetical protein